MTNEALKTPGNIGEILLAKYFPGKTKEEIFEEALEEGYEIEGLKLMANYTTLKPVSMKEIFGKTITEEKQK